MDSMRSSNTCLNNFGSLGAAVPPDFQNQNTTLTNTHINNVPGSIGGAPLHFANANAIMQPQFAAASFINNNNTVNNPIVGQNSVIQNGNVLNTSELNNQAQHPSPSPSSIVNFQFPTAVTTPPFPTGATLMPPNGNYYTMVPSPTMVSSFPAFTFPVAGQQNQFPGLQQISGNQQIPGTTPIQVNSIQTTPTIQMNPIQTTPVMTSIPAHPQPAGYEMQISTNTNNSIGGHQPAPIFDSGQHQQPLWKCDPAKQTPTGQQQIYTLPTTGYTACIRTPEGALIPQFPQYQFNMNTASVAATSSYAPTECSDSTIMVPSGSVESGVSTMSTTGHFDPNIFDMQNSTFSAASITNNTSSCMMEFMGSNKQSSNFQQFTGLTQLPTTNSNNLGADIPPTTTEQDITMSTPSNDVRNNNLVVHENNRNGHRGPSQRPSKSKTPPGFAEAHRLSNIAKAKDQHPTPKNYVNHQNDENSRHVYQGAVESRRRNDNMRNRNRAYSRRYHQNENWTKVSAPRSHNQRSRRNNNSRHPNSSQNQTRNGGNKPRTKRFGYRTKQNKIEEVYANVTQHFEELDVLSPEDVGIRGTNVARLHVKKWHSLCNIEEAIERVEQDDRIVTLRVSCPVSMKNLYQKKGFLLYWETENEEQTELLMNTFRSFAAEKERENQGKWILDEFQKIGVALQTVEQKQGPAETAIDQNTASPVVKNIVSKAVVASLDNLATAKPTSGFEEVKNQSLFDVFTEVRSFDETEPAFEPPKSMAELAFPMSKAADELFDDDDFGIIPLEKMSSINSLCGA